MSKSHSALRPGGRRCEEKSPPCAYRYSKWLAPLAARAPTGAKIVTIVKESIELIERGVLRDHSPAASNPLILSLRRLREPLIDAAHAAGIDSEWLTKWWLHIDTSRQCIDDVSW